MGAADPIPVWLDTDPGVDDAMAMALLFALPEYDVKGVSAVAGNVELEKTFENARDLAAFFGRKDVPVFAGAARPLFRAPGRPPSSTGRTASGT